MEFAHIKEMELDLARMTSRPKQGSSTRLLQGSMTVFLFHILENGEPANLGNVGRIVVNFRKPDRSIISREIPFSGNVATYVLGPQEYGQAGSALIDLKFYSTDDSDYIIAEPFSATISATVGSGTLLDDIEGPGDSTPVTPVISGLAYFGKWFEDTNGRSTHYPGSSIVTNVTGTTSIIANFDYTGAGWQEAPIIAYRLNGGAWERKPVATAVTLATGLTASQSYKLEIVFDGWNQMDLLWNEQLKLTFKSLSISEGATASYTNEKKNILVVGDSITAGTRTLGGTDVARDSSAVAAFSWLLAEERDANLFTSAFPGTKVTDPFTRENVKVVTENVLIPNYDIEEVFIVMGTNDYQIASETFITGYQLLIDSLRTLYPTQPFYIVGLFESLASIRRNTELASLAVSNANVTHIDTSRLAGVTYSDGLHPNVAGNRTICNYIVNEIENPGGGESPVPDGNIWTIAGKQADYNPLPSDWNRIPIPTTYAGYTYEISFTASSAVLGSVRVYTEYSPDFNETIQLTATPTAYTRTFTVTYTTAENNFFYIIPLDFGAHTDIVITGITLEKQ